ncbi:QDE-2-interacting [Fusarium agapanthi]|uniref:QDE-2-interacting n=1 Tax=Fusarium agapanthi TaxID=1803897 RepID=A0A9P5BKI8_9HYPO|nr:QDE-2-interacting [Fusarium agapanthi]
MSGTEKDYHSWFKRPELFLPQWVMGYAVEARRGLLKEWHYTGSSFQILSIDVADDVVRRGEVDSFQIGISILDTDRLGDALANPPEPDVNLAASVVESHHWVVGVEEYPPEFEDSFRFGRMRSVPINKFAEQIKAIVQNENFFLISHGPDKSLSFLRSCGVHFEAIETIDTERAVHKFFKVPPDKVEIKRELIKEMGVPCQDPDLAGNAAHFTLRILLKVVCGDVDQHPQKEGVPVHKWSLLLQRIVGSPSKKRKLRRMRTSPVDSSE